MLLTALQIICVVNFLLFAGTIFYKSKKLDPSFSVFGFFLLGKGLTLLGSLIITNYDWKENFVIYYIGTLLDSFLYFYGPFLYFFALCLTKGQISLNDKKIHFIPFAVFFVLNLVLMPCFYFYPENSVSYTILHVRNSFNQFYYPIIIIYSIAALFIIFKKKTDNKRYIKLSNWFKTIITVFLLIWFVFLTSELLLDKVSESFTSTLSTIGILLLFILSNLTLVFLINHPQYFYNNLSVKLTLEKRNELINEQSYNKLCELVVKEALFKNADLKVGDLAVKMDLSPRNISNLINTFDGGNFYDFINIYRINESKKLLRQYEDDATILTILYESGFNSKSVFNNTFKKIVGETPSVYRKNHMKQKYG